MRKKNRCKKSFRFENFLTISDCTVTSLWVQRFLFNLFLVLGGCFLLTFLKQVCFAQKKKNNQPRDMIFMPFQVAMERCRFSDKSKFNLMQKGRFITLSG